MMQLLLKMAVSINYKHQNLNEDFFDSWFILRLIGLATVRGGGLGVARWPTHIWVGTFRGISAIPLGSMEIAL